MNHTATAPERANPSTTTLHETNIYHHTWLGRIKRISWGAIFAGLLVAISLQLFLSMLGLTIGFWSIDPVTEANPMNGLGVGGGIWWIVTGSISLFIGSWVAARLAGRSNPVEGGLHGVVCWAAVTFLSFYLVGSTIGSVLSATTSALSQGFSAAGNLAANIAESKPGGKSLAARMNINFKAIGNELSKTLRETDKKALKPENLEDAAQKLVATAENAATRVAKNPNAAQAELNRVMDAFYSQYNDVKAAVDDEAITNVIVANSDMSKQEAQKVVDRWENQYQQAKQELKQEAKELKHDAKVVANDVTDFMAEAGLWVFLTMLLGLIASIGGGGLGSVSTPPVEENEAVETD